MKGFLFLSFIIMSPFLQAELVVWAYKGQIKVEINKEKKLVSLDDTISTQTMIYLTGHESYLALIETNTQKVIELQGQQKISYQEVVKQLQVIPHFIELPLTITIEKKGSVYRGCRCIGKSLYDLYPVDHEELFMDKRDTLIVCWQKNDFNERKKSENNQDVLVIKNMFDEVVYQRYIQNLDNQIIIPSNILARVNHGIVLEIRNENSTEEEPYTRKSIIWKNQAKIQNKINQIMNNPSVANQVVAMLYAYHSGSYGKGLHLFLALKNELPKYQGFDQYYNELYKFYIQEDQK